VGGLGPADAEPAPDHGHADVHVGGTAILFAFPAGIPPNGGTAPFLSEIWIGGVLEVFGGGLLLLGLFTRPVAFLLSGEMAVAYFQFHAPGGFWPTLNGGVPAVLYCFVWLYFSAAGPGRGAWMLGGEPGPVRERVA